MMQHVAAKLFGPSYPARKITASIEKALLTSNYFVRLVHLSSQVKLDHYEILGAKRNASASEIKQLYLEKCKLYHPDKHNGNAGMHEKFVQVREAYSTLSNPVARKDYDHGLQYRDMRNQGFARHEKSTYSWNNAHTRAKPEDVWRTWQNNAHTRARQEGWHSWHENNESSYHKGYQTYNGRDYGAGSRRSSYNSRVYNDPRVRRDRLNEYWESVYNQSRNSHKHNSHPYSKSISAQERSLISVFLLTIFFVLAIRAYLSLCSNNRPYDFEYYDVRQKQTQPENKRPPKDGGDTNFEEA